MHKIRILSVKNIALALDGFSNVKRPEAGFSISLNLDTAQEILLKDPKNLQALEALAKGAYNKYLLETNKRLLKFEKLFSGMLNKGAAPDEVATQADALKLALEMEIPKWEKAAEREVNAALKNITQKKR